MDEHRPVNIAQGGAASSSICHVIFQYTSSLATLIPYILLKILLLYIYSILCIFIDTIGSSTTIEMPVLKMAAAGVTLLSQQSSLY